MSSNNEFYARYLGGQPAAPPSEADEADKGDAQPQRPEEESPPEPSEPAPTAREKDTEILPKTGPPPAQKTGPPPPQKTGRPDTTGGPPGPEAYWPESTGRHGYNEPPSRADKGPGTTVPLPPAPAVGRNGPAARTDRNLAQKGPAVQEPTRVPPPQQPAPPPSPQPAPPSSGDQPGQPGLSGVGARYVPPQRSRPPQASARPPAAPPGRPMTPGGRPASESVGPLRANVRPADLVRPYKPTPETGWRKLLYRITRINVGLSPAEREWNDLRRRVGMNLRGTYLIALMQQKGGVAKTTATIGLGAALARYRDDKIVAIDGNPASGNLGRRIDEPSTGTWRGLVADQRLNAYSDFRFYLGKDSSSGLEVLAGDPGDEVITGEQLTEVWQRLQRQYPVGLVDCGTQLRDDVTAAILGTVDAVVVLSTTRLDGALAAEDTLNWLVTHGYPHLVRSAVLLISDVNKVTPNKTVRALHEQFENAVRAVHDVPFDPHLSDATAIDFDRLKPATRRAFIEAAASLVDGFSGAADKDPGALGWAVRELR